MAGRMAELDSDQVLTKVDPVALSDRRQAAWVLLGIAGRDAVGEVSERLRRDASDVLWMLDVAAVEVLRNRPGRKRGARRVVRKH